MGRLRLIGPLTALVIGGCTLPTPPATPGAPASPPAAAPPAAAQRPATFVPHYSCDQNIEFTVQFGDDTALIDTGPGGREVLLRDAGGVTPEQTFYSNPRLRAEFGLGDGGREAILRYPSPPRVAHCQRSEAAR